MAVEVKVIVGEPVAVEIGVFNEVLVGVAVFEGVDVTVAVRVIVGVKVGVGVGARDTSDSKSILKKLLSENSS